jgi:hypothetical protein
MAWTSPRTWVAGEVVTAALMNTHIRDNLTELRAGGIAVASQVLGDTLVPASATALQRIAAGTLGYFWRAGGAGVAPGWAQLAPNLCNAYHNTTQNVTSGHTDALNLNSEDFDTNSMHDTSTNNNRVTIPIGGGGFYVAIGITQVGSGANPNATLHIRRSGSGLVSSTRPNSGSTLPNTGICLVVLANMTAGQYFDLAGESVGETTTFGSATASLATRLIVFGPLAV